MKAGLFVCDHVQLEYQPQFGDYPDMFARLFPEFEFILYDVYNGHFPESIEECDLYMTTGSSHSVYEDLHWINQLKQVIRDIHDQDKYFIGFCFGHQLIGEALGGKVKKSPNGWCIGVHEFEMVEQKEWMKPPQSQFNLLMMCQDQIIQLPENALVLAGNKKCPIGMIQMGQKILGIQAHPEYSKAYDQTLMENRINRMGQEVVKQGIESLENPVHQNLIHDWVINFISKPS
ncbi:MAG: GMP synthase-like glutamine amidotransferase [Saprospiraceae bacterium]|jgi:GMP synthase-like glutamine amidotransferase